MSWYSVMVEGCGLRLVVDDVEGLYGFYKNVLVEAADSATAASQALSAVRGHEKLRGALNASDIELFALRVDVASDPPDPQVDQGFVFFPDHTGGLG